MASGEVDINISKEDVTSWLERLVEGLPERASNLVEDIADQYRYSMSSEAPVRTGFLQNSHVVESLSPLERIIYPTMPYAIFVVEGTKPHEILPVNRKALFWPDAEHPVKRVMHPGTAANPYIDRAFEGTNVDSLVDAFLDWVESG